MNPNITKDTTAKRRAVQLMLKGSVQAYITYLTREVAQAPRARA